MGRLRCPALCRAPLAPVAVLALLAGLAAPAAAQMNDYEMRYGQTVEVSVDNLLQMPESYVDKAVRTRGQLDMVPTTGRITYSLRGTFGGHLYLYPTAEAGADFEQLARQWVGKEVEVTGAVGISSLSGQGSATRPASRSSISWCGPTSGRPTTSRGTGRTPRRCRSRIW